MPAYKRDDGSQCTRPPDASVLPGSEQEAQLMDTVEKGLTVASILQFLREG